MSAIAILGAGTWGTALAATLSRAGHDVVLWSALSHELTALARDRTHPHLPGATLPAQVRLEADLRDACAEQAFVFFAVPSVYVRSTALSARAHIRGGQVLVDGNDIVQYTPKQLIGYRRHDIGFVFQFYNLVQNLTALENVELAAQICEDPMPAAEALEAVGLGHRLDNFPAQLSGGEQQRVSIARALAKRPKLLLCDEPTGALDYNTGKQILSLLQSACREGGMTVIVVTHNTAITPMADRVITIRNSKVASNIYNPHPADIATIEW